jgi:hypothetical protein
MKRGTKTRIGHSLRAVRATYKKVTRKGHYAKAVYLRKYAKLHADLLREVAA